MYSRIQHHTHAAYQHTAMADTDVPERMEIGYTYSSFAGSSVDPRMERRKSWASAKLASWFVHVCVCVCMLPYGMHYYNDSHPNNTYLKVLLGIVQQNYKSITRSEQCSRHGCAVKLVYNDHPWDTVKWLL